VNKTGAFLMMNKSIGFLMLITLLINSCALIPVTQQESRMTPGAGMPAISISTPSAISRMPTQTSEATLAAIEIAPPIPTSKSIQGWLNYRNTLLSYELSYPPKATLLTAGVTGFPAEELPPDMTPDEYLAKLRRIYSGDLCITIQYRFGFIAIEAPQDQGGKYTGPCGVTGVGDYDVIEKTEKVNVGGQSYSATGYEVHQSDTSATFRSEFFKLQLKDGT
jgi:hypothetical protein